MKRNGDSRLYLIGTGPYADTVRELISKLDLDEYVMLLGSVSQSELPFYYRAADCTVMPSFLEWFGVVAAESMACGTPVIATEAGGAIDIVREFECGILVPPRDSIALAEAMAEMLSGTVATSPNIERARASFDWTQKLNHTFRLFAKMRSEDGSQVYTSAT